MFGRRSSASEPTSELPDKVAGKGRPTPTRKEAEAARKQRLTAPRTRKEQAAARRAAIKGERQQTRAALSGGDDKYLPARDQGPLKRYVRDYVDVHRTVGEYLMPAFLVILLLLITAGEALSQYIAWSWYAVILVMFADSYRLVRGAKKAVAAKFGDDQTGGLTMYVSMRALQMRRLRLPKPMVKAGDPI